MTLTVRLDPELEREFAALCGLKRATKSAIVSELIRTYLQAQAPRQSAFELAEAMGLVGVQERAPAAGRDHSRYIKGKLRQRRPAKPRERRAG
jgi:predicted transcriptional regulator